MEFNPPLEQSLPLQPSEQSHVNDPSIFIQIAPFSQSPIPPFAAHSFTSLNRNRRIENIEDVFNLKNMSIHLPSSHSAPVHPSSHVQVNDPSVFVHVAPFLQSPNPELAAHSFLSICRNGIYIQPYIQSVKTDLF